MILDKLLFNRDHFPILLHEFRRTYGPGYQEFGRIEIPPYHPSMAGNGINFKSVPDLLHGVVQATIRDLRLIADKRPDIGDLLEKIDSQVKGNAIVDPETNFEITESGIEVGIVPIADTLYVGKHEIKPSIDSDEGVSVTEEGGNIIVPTHADFGPELLREYKMEEASSNLGLRIFKCPYVWKKNLPETNGIPITEIFYGNLVMALDNAAVREKYG